MPSDLPALDPRVVGFSAARGLPGGGMRQYSAVEFTRGWAGAEQFLRQLRVCGYVRPSTGATDGQTAGNTGLMETRRCQTTGLQVAAL